MYRYNDTYVILNTFIYPRSPPPSMRGIWLAIASTTLPQHMPTCQRRRPHWITGSLARSTDRPTLSGSYCTVHCSSPTCSSPAPQDPHTPPDSKHPALTQGSYEAAVVWGASTPVCRLSIRHRQLPRATAAAAARRPAAGRHWKGRVSCPARALMIAV